MRHTLLLLAAFMLMLPSLSAQIEGKVELLPDNQTYRVSVLPSVTLYPPLSITNNAQITVKVPTGGFVFDGITSITGLWTLQNSVIAPVEDPDYDYYAFDAATMTNVIYESGTEVELFTFRNSGDCTGTLEIIDNATDPFMPPNSVSVNIGNLFSILGVGVGANAYSGNYAVGLAECPEVLSFSVVPEVVTVDCNGETTSLQVSVTGGVASYDIEYGKVGDPSTNASTSIGTQNGSTPQLGNFTAGRWWFEVRDSDMNTARDSLDITEPLPLTLTNITLSDADCDVSADGSISLDVSGGTAPYTYLWSDGTTDPMAENLNPGNYDLTVTDAKNCSIKLNDLIIGAVNSLSFDGFDIQNASCGASADGSITPSVTGGTAPYTFLWNDGSTDQTITDLGAGIYAVTATDANGCEVSQNDIPVTNAGTLSLSLVSMDPANCENSADGTLEVIAEGGQSPYTYSWSNGSTGASASTFNPGSYTASVTDALGCTALLGNLEVTMDGFIDVIATARDPFCFGDTDAEASLEVTGSAAPFTYQWAHSAGATGPVLTDITSGTYYFTVTDATGVCQVADSVTVGVPQRMSIETAIQSPTCFGDEDGTILITEVLNAALPVTTSLDGTNFGQEMEFSPLAGGNYTVYVEDANGCVDQKEVLLYEPVKLTVELGDDFLVQLGESYEFQPASTGTPTIWEWSSTDSLDCTDCPNPTITPFDAGLIRVTVMDSSGCTASDQVRLFVERPRNIYVPNAFSPNGDGRNDQFHVFYGDDVREVRDLVIYDRWGDQVFARPGAIPSADPSYGWDGWVRNQPAPSGVFVYSFQVEYIDGEVEQMEGDVTLMK